MKHAILNMSGFSKAELASQNPAGFATQSRGGGKKSRSPEVRLRLDEGEAGIANRRMVLRHPDGHLAVVGVRAGLVPYAVPTSPRQPHKAFQELGLTHAVVSITSPFAQQQTQKRSKGQESAGT